jgi:hypothetical protein
MDATLRDEEELKKALQGQHIAESAAVEMLYAAAEAHPSWEVVPGDMGIRYIGYGGPDTPEKLLRWFMKKGRH